MSLQDPHDIQEDSDIEEIIVVAPPRGASSNDHGRASVHSPVPSTKRRRSSPQMDPIPSYASTITNLIDQQRKMTSAADEPPSTIDTQNTHGCHTSPTFTSSITGHRKCAGEDGVFSQSRLDTATRSPARDSFCDRKVVQDIRSLRHVGAPSSRIGDSIDEINQPWSTNKRLEHLSTARSPQSYSISRIAPCQQQSTAEDSVKVVMWSPKIPAEIASTVHIISDNSSEDIRDDLEYNPPNPPKKRIAHKPTIPKNKQNRPKLPLGTSKKVPIAFRSRYLDVIINEYLNCGHDEETSYQDGLKEEQALATRAATKSIYVNLVAGLKRKIREKAGLLSETRDDVPKYVNGNKIVSHEDILIGKAAGTFSIQRKRKISDPGQLSEPELYDRLTRYVLPHDLLASYNYPSRDPEDPELRLAPQGKDGLKVKLRAELASSYTCDRCLKVYRVDEQGVPLDATGACIFHPGHLWNERINRALEKRYSCCKGDLSAGGCSTNKYHVHNGELELANYMHYVETKPRHEWDPNGHGIYALDCEMCYTTCGLELTRVTVVNHKSDVVYEKLVRPRNPILDYNTKFSGIKPGDLDCVNTSLEDVQADLMKMFSDKTILVGHSLDSDMRALKIYHKRFIDTAQLFPHKRGLPYKRALRTLMVENLQLIIQEDAGHDSKEDARAALRLVMWKAKTDVAEKAV